MMTKKYTTAQLIDRWEDKRAIQNLMGKYSSHFLIKRESEIFPELWSKKEDVCLGVNEGWYLGPKSVEGWYLAKRDYTALCSKLIQKAFPEKLGDMPDEELYGTGTFDLKPVDTCVIEIASDRETAKGVWYERGSYAALTPGGPVSYWTFGAYAVDFIRENSVWKIWHMQYLKDVDSPCGKSWAEKSEPYPEIEVFKPVAEFKMPAPDVQTQIRELYHTHRKFSPLPEPPRPYETFERTFSYGFIKGE